MSGSQAELCYRRAAVQNSSSAGLVVILYDMMVGDLRAAIKALRNKDVQGRSDRLKQAFAILELLEGSLDWEHGRAAAESLSQFYSYLRGRLLMAQFGSDDKLLEEQISLILDVQQAWRDVDAPAQPGLVTTEPKSAAQHIATGAQQWSA